MRIEFLCTGGIANLNLEYQVDTEQLSEEMVDQLHALLEDAHLVDREPTMLSEVPGAADFFSYRLHIRQEGEEKTFFFSDVNAPDEVRPLLDHLRNLAVQQKMKGNK